MEPSPSEAGSESMVVVLFCLFRWVFSLLLADLLLLLPPPVLVGVEIVIGGM